MGISASMGPRHRCRGIECPRPPPGRPGHCFNGATASLPWNRRNSPHQRCPFSALQWGHGIAAVESQKRPGQLYGWETLQWGHGIAAVESEYRLPGMTISELLQWGHGIAAVESLQKVTQQRHPQAASMGPRHRCRGIFQEARALMGDFEASMGPRHRCRGIICNGAASTTASSASMGPRLAAVESHTSFRPRPPNAELQWGHGIAAVESKIEEGTYEHDGKTLQWGHGIAAVESLVLIAGECLRNYCFNGATASLPWNHSRPPAGLLARPGASMGPRHRCRGIAITTARPDTVSSGFNGATASLPWNLYRSHWRLSYH